MGILESGLLGPFRNKVGPAVGRKHNGQNLIVAAYRKSRKPPTAEQLREREKFGLLNGFLSCIPDLVAPGFKKYAKKKSALNAAYSYNYPNAFMPATPDNDHSATGENADEEAKTAGPRLNFSALVYSRGDIAMPDGLNVSRHGNHVVFNWSAQQQSFYCQLSDLASFLVCAEDEKDFVVRLRAAERHELSFEMEVPATFNGPLHCYMSFASADGKLPGNSKYAGAITHFSIPTT